MPISPELQRIKRVYQGYQADPAKQAQWSLDNPGNRAILEERRWTIQWTLQEHHFLLLDNKRILEIGCGSGKVLADFLAWGAQPQNLYGMDLLPERIEFAKRQYPDFHFECANAESLNFPDAMFDLVLFFTVFSSILDMRMQQQVASEAQRVLKKDGGILWYDFRYNSPGNPNVRGMSKKNIQGLFPGFTISLKSITLLPPLARRLGRLTPVLYPLFISIPFFRTHYLGLFVKR